MNACIVNAGQQEAYLKETGPLSRWLILEVKMANAPASRFERVVMDRHMALAVANWILENLQDPT
jgi:hypothetical protein